MECASSAVRVDRTVCVATGGRRPRILIGPVSQSPAILMANDPPGVFQLCLAEAWSVRRAAAEVAGIHRTAGKYIVKQSFIPDRPVHIYVVVSQIGRCFLRELGVVIVKSETRKSGRHIHDQTFVFIKLCPPVREGSTHYGLVHREGLDELTNCQGLIGVLEFPRV